MSKAIQANIVKRIIEALEKGVIPWVKPWNSCFPYNVVSKKAYSGVNALLLMYANGGPAFLTEKQGIDLGGSLKPDARYELICYLGSYKRKHKKNENDETKAYSFLRYYKVYAVTAFDGLEQYHYKGNGLEHKPIDEAEEIVSALAPEIRLGGDSAAYSPTIDIIRMPEQKNFFNMEYWYATLFHELAHWTGHKTRCDRDLSGHFGSEEYAREELTAEIISALLCSSIGLSDAMITNAEAYCASWIKALKETPANAITSAASKAFKAWEYIENARNTALANVVV